MEVNTEKKKKEWKDVNMFASREQDLREGGCTRGQLFLLGSLVILLALFSLNSMSNWGPWVIHQCSPQQQHPSLLTASTASPENQKHWFPHRGAWSDCHSSLPPEPRSCEFPMHAWAVGSMMRVLAGILICVSFNVPCHLCGMWWAEKWSARSGLCDLPVFPSLRPFSLVLSSFLFFPLC